jgi:hypothetical protein
MHQKLNFEFDKNSCCINIAKMAFITLATTCMFLLLKSLDFPENPAGVSCLGKTCQIT